MTVPYSTKQQRRRSIRSEEEKRKLRAMYAEMAKRDRLQRRLAKVAGVGKRDLAGVRDFHYRQQIPEHMIPSVEYTGTPAYQRLQGLYFSPNRMHKKDQRESELFVRRKTKLGSRDVLRHEIGHNVYFQSPKEVRYVIDSLLHAQRIKDKTDKLMWSPREEFADIYASQRNARRHKLPRGSTLHREALALALVEIRKKKQKGRR